LRWRSATDQPDLEHGTCTFSNAVSVGSRWKAWKMKPMFCGAEGGRVFELGDGLALKQDLPLVGHIERAKQAEQGGFAAAAAANDGDKLALFDLQNSRRAGPAHGRRRSRDARPPPPAEQGLRVTIWFQW